MKKKILRMLLIIVLVIILIGAAFLINTFRKYLIIKGLQEKIAEYSTSTNFYVQINMKDDYTEDKTVFTYYEKDEKSLLIADLEWYDDGTQYYYITSTYNNGERVDVFYDSLEEGKTVEINSEEYYGVTMIYNGLETDSKFETFLACFSVNISETEYNGKECYVIKNFIGNTFTSGETIYIEKDTGLLVAVISSYTVSDETTEQEVLQTNEYEYEFDNVDDSVFVEPDIGEYTIMEEE